VSNGLDRSCRATQSSCSRSRRWSRHRCWYATSRFVQGRIFVLRQTQNRRKPTAEKKQWITTWKETIVLWYAFQNHLKQTWTGSQLKAPNCKWKHKGFIQLNTCISKPEVNTSINMLLTWVIRCESCLATSCFTFLLSNLQERCYEKIVKKKDPHNQNAIQHCWQRCWGPHRSKQTAMLTAMNLPSQWKRQTTEHKPQENLTSYPYMMMQIIMAVKRWRTPNSQKNDSSYSTKNLPTQTQPQHQKEQPHNISETEEEPAKLNHDHHIHGKKETSSSKKRLPKAKRPPDETYTGTSDTNRKKIMHQINPIETDYKNLEARTRNNLQSQLINRNAH